MSSSANYDYLGIQALPPRKKGRDRRRMNQARGIKEEDETATSMTVAAEETVIDDPFSPLVEEYILNNSIIIRFAHVRIPDGLEYSAERPLQYEFLDNTADIQVHACMYS